MADRYQDAVLSLLNNRWLEPELAQLRLGTWVVKNGELCLTRKSRKQTLTECFEVWQWQDHIEYRRDGVTIMKAVLRRK